MRSSLLLSIALASLALASPLPDIEPVEFTPRPTKTMTCDCSKVTDCAEKRPAKRSEASKACLTRDVVDSVIADVTYFLTQAAVDPAGVNSTADRIFTENLEIWSGGMKFLADVPLGDHVPALSSRSSFVDLEYQPPYGQAVSTIDVFFTCRKIAWRWIREYPNKELLPVSGITTFEMIYKDDTPSTPITTAATLTTTTAPSSETVAIIPPECPYGDASDGVFNGGICPAQPKQRRAVPVLDTTTSTTTTTSTAANATQTLDAAALDLLAALADDEPLPPQTEGPGCAPGNSPGGDPNAGDCEEVKRDAVADDDTPPPTADRDRDVDIDNFKLKLKPRTGEQERDPRGETRDLTNPPNPHTLPNTEDLPANRNPDAQIDRRDTSAGARGFAELVERAPGGPSPELLDDDEEDDDVPVDDDADTCGEDTTKEHEERDGNSRNWRIRKMAIEFNSGAWVRNLGGECAV